MKHKMADLGYLWDVRYAAHVCSPRGLDVVHSSLTLRRRGRGRRGCATDHRPSSRRRRGRVLCSVDRPGETTNSNSRHVSLKLKFPRQVRAPLKLVSKTGASFFQFADKRIRCRQWRNDRITRLDWFQGSQDASGKKTRA